MRCTQEKLSVSAATLCGAGSAASVVISAGILLVPAILGAIGSLLFFICALQDLADCLDRDGKHLEAARLRDPVKSLEHDVDMLKQRLAEATGFSL